MNKAPLEFDYAFIGLGCANSLILLELYRKGLLDAKTILIIEPEEKRQNDKTFCFWLTPNQIENYGLASLISHAWNQLKNNNLPIQTLEEKRYYYLRADHLYAHVREILALFNVERRNITYEDQPDFTATYIFDSRPPNWQQVSSYHVHIKQSFFGQIIRTENPVFDQDVFTMMDFDIAQNGHTQFMYILPFSANEALIEPTRFGKLAMTKSEALELIATYMMKKGSAYEVLDEENGCIPMSSVSLIENTKQTNNWLKTGSGGGQLKPSTGYSFVRNLEDSELIIESIQNESQINRRVSKKRFRYYDRLLLLILERFPSKGKLIFSQLFEKNKASNVLHFLDERSSIWQEIKIMQSLPILTFLCAAVLDFGFVIMNFMKQRSWLTLFCLLFLLLGFFQLQLVINSILIFGLFAIGIPHGALDHLYQNSSNHPLNLKFIAIYLVLGLAMFVIWQWFPIPALIIFLTYTAWHFGQADFHHWGIKSAIGSFLWGILLLGVILLGHWPQTSEILALMKVPMPEFHYSLNFLNSWDILLMLLIVFATGRLLKINKHILETMLVLIISWQLPLVTAFGLYFIFQHSWHGWTFLQIALDRNFIQLWKKAAIFSSGALLIFLTPILLYGLNQYNWGLFFIFLSALSFPHVLFMHSFYLRSK